MTRLPNAGICFVLVADKQDVSKADAVKAAAEAVYSPPALLLRQVGGGRGKQRAGE